MVLENPGPAEPEGEVQDPSHDIIVLLSREGSVKSIPLSSRFEQHILTSHGLDAILQTKPTRHVGKAFVVVNTHFSSYYHFFAEVCPIVHRNCSLRVPTGIEI